MWLSKKTYNLGTNHNQTIIRVFNYPILYHKSSDGWSIRFGHPGFGVNVTTKFI
jgi:hypothetical protein